VEEVIRSLIDSEAITYDEATARWQATQEAADIAIPDTLQGVLTARIDRLQEETRRVLQMASLIGRIFLYRILDAIATTATVAGEKGACPERSRRALDEHLLTLQREEMIRERARLPELEYIFKHHLTHQAAYNGLLRRERRLFHRQVAEVLKRLFPHRIEEQLGLLAHHWEQAGEREKAIGYLRRSGEQAAAQFANAEALAYFSRALDLVPPEDLALRCELLLARERVYELQGEREARAQELVTLEDLAEALDDGALRAKVALRQAQYSYLNGDYPEAIGAAQTSVRMAQATHDAETEVMGHIQWGAALYDQGDYGEARDHLEEALILAQAAGFRQQEAFCLCRLAFMCVYEQHYAGTRAYYEQARRIYRQIGDRRGEAMATTEFVYMFEGELDEVRASVERRLQIFREIGDRRHEGWSILALGVIFYYLGDYARARNSFEQSLRVLCETGHSRGEGIALGALSSLYHQLGDNQAARHYSQQALLVGQGADDRRVQAYALGSMGHVLAGLGRSSEAMDAYREAVALRRQLGEHHLANAPLAGLARVCLAQGDLHQAQAYVEEILSYLKTGTLHGPTEPFRVYLTCYRVLRAQGDPALMQSYRLPTTCCASGPPISATRMSGDPSWRTSRSTER
jgi:tetratricopeptide (TPR) repeat protein